MSLRKTGWPLKQRELLSGAPPKAWQKSVWDCQRSVSLAEVEFCGTPPALPCNEGAKGEFKMEVF